MCWLIWVLNAYDREIILRLGPTISEAFDLSPDHWGVIVSLCFLALAGCALAGAVLQIFVKYYGIVHAIVDADALTVGK